MCVLIVCMETEDLYFAENLNRLMEIQGISNVELSKRIKSSDRQGTTILRYRNGTEKNPSLKMLKNIANGLNCSIYELIDTPPISLIGLTEKEKQIIYKLMKILKQDKEKSCLATEFIDMLYRKLTKELKEISMSKKKKIINKDS